MSAFGKFQALLLQLPHTFDMAVNDDQLVPVKVATVAVWDTTGPVGTPALDSHGDIIEALQFVDNKLSDKVLKGFHAISLESGLSDGALKWMTETIRPEYFASEA